MVELDDILQPAREDMERIGAADLVIGILSPSPRAEMEPLLADIREAIAQLDMPLRTIVVHGYAGAAREGAEGEVQLLHYPLFPPDASADSVRGVSAAYRAVFGVSENLGARACAVLLSDLETVTAGWIHRLIQPLLEREFDLVAPCYAHRKFEGLLNSSIIAPLTRALYGKQIQHPLGPDFAFSGRLVHRFLDPAAGRTAGARPLTALASDAIREGFEICQANLGVRLYPHTDWMNQSSVLAQILGPVFQEVERNAAFWQRIRGSQPVPVFGEAGPAQEETGRVDVDRMIESFQLGCRSLQDVWGSVLPPGTLLALNKLARVARDDFRLPDELWVRVIFDFALGHRLRMISPDHMLRAMTPLYLAWVASYSLEMENAAEPALARRLEQLCMAYEAGKPYVLSRWRWPDRFNP